MHDSIRQLFINTGFKILIKDDKLFKIRNMQNALQYNQSLLWEVAINYLNLE